MWCDTMVEYGVGGGVGVHVGVVVVRMLELTGVAWMVVVGRDGGTVLMVVSRTHQFVE